MKNDEYFDPDLVSGDSPLAQLSAVPADTLPDPTAPQEETGIPAEEPAGLPPKKKPLEFYGHNWKTWCGILLAGTLLFAYALWPEKPASPAHGALVSTPETAAAVTPSGPATPQATSASPADVSALQQDMTTILTAQQQYSGKNREAITLLARRIDEQDKQIALLTARLSTQDARLAALAAAPVAPAGKQPAPVTHRKTTRAATAGWHISSVYPGMAWLEHGGSTWAVAVGDSLKGLHITAIDPQRREVITAEGVIKE